MTASQWHYFLTNGIATAVLTLFASQSQGAPRFDSDFRVATSIPSLVWEHTAYTDLHALIPQPAEEEPLPPQF